MPNWAKVDVIERTLRDSEGNKIYRFTPVELETKRAMQEHNKRWPTHIGYWLEKNT